MQEYEFRIGMHEDCTGVDMPVAEWTTQGAGMFLNGTVAICMSTKSWNEAPEDKPIVLVGAEQILYDLFLDWLGTQFDLRGHFISPVRFSPRQLYEALSQGWEYGWAVDGPVPDDPDGENGEETSGIYEVAAISTPQTDNENIERGIMAMKHVISSHKFEPHAMFRKDIGWIAFYWGKPGDAPKECKDGKELKGWLEKQGSGYVPFQHGYGIAHIIAKRDWEGRWIKPLLGQRGKEFAIKLVQVLAEGKASQTTNGIEILQNDIKTVLRKQKHGREDIFLLTGFETVSHRSYVILESIVEYGSASTQIRRTMPCSQNPQREPPIPTHHTPNGCLRMVGATDSKTIDFSLSNNTPEINPKQGENPMNSAIFERAQLDMQTESEVRSTSTIKELQDVILRVFGAALPPQPDDYKNENSDYGLKVKGVKARERINAQCREILERVKDDPAALTEEDKAVLRQYSGRGGTSDNSQYEYYTPTHVAEGVWDALKANGFENGNVLDPCCGAGIFEGVKPAGVVMSANDLDPIGSGVAALLNPTDNVSTRPFEDVVMSTEDDTFDSAIGNVPFGNARGASMHLDPAYKNEKSIERYFLLRALDKIRPGGLACFICPTNIVGNKGGKWEQFRIALSKKAEFLGAHKLPSKTFAAQGTNTVVDVVVLRKHSRDLLTRLRNDEIPFETLKEANVIWDEFISGKYWLGEGRKFIMGKYVPKVPGDRWSREEVDGDIDNMTLKRNLARKFHSRINWELLNDAEPILRAYAEGDRRFIDGTQYEFISGQWTKVLETVVADNIDANRYGADSIDGVRGILNSPKGALGLTLEQAQAVASDYPELLTPQQKAAVEFALVQREDCQEQVYRGSILGNMIAKMGADEAGGEDVTLRRQALQEAVIAEIEKYGHPANNKNLNLLGEQSRAFGMFKNAVDAKGNFSDLLSGNLDKTAGNAFDPSNAAEIVSHLFASDETPIEFEDVRKLYQGSMKLESLADLADVEGIAVTPDGTLMPYERYCSGDVMKKIADCMEAASYEDDPRLVAKYNAQIARMQAKMAHTNLEDMTFALRDKWYSTKHIVEFLRENGFPDAAYIVEKEVDEEQYDGSIERRTKKVSGDYDTPGGKINLGLRGKEAEGFNKQFEKYLNGGKVTSSTAENIELYREQVRNFEQQYDSWIRQQAEIDELAEQYNLRFNSYVPFEYDTGSLGIEDVLSGDITPHTYQNAEVRRLSEQGSGICGFGVGLGKSFTALAMAAYNAKKGRSKRTCVVVPSAVLENWYHEARMFYNESYMRNSVFFVGLEPQMDSEGGYIRRPLLDETGQPRTREDGTQLMQDIVKFANSPQQIYDAMWKIPQSNFKLVVMTKEKFKEIPLRPETMKNYTNSMVERGLMSQNAQKKAMDDEAKKGKSYAEDVALIKMQEKFSDGGTKKKAALPYLEDMGFDSIITDESHFFKNSLEGGENTSNVAYLPNPAPSQIARDMSIKSDYIRRKNGGRGVYGLTATPVTNSPLEIFNMLSLVAPMEEFERFGVYTPDDFVDTFGMINQIQRGNVAGEIVSSDALVGFKNLDGLRNIFHKYVNIKTVEDVDSVIHVPNAEEVTEDVAMSQEQEDAYVKLRQRVANMAANNAAEKQLAALENRKPRYDSLFSVMRDMDRCTTDMDMLKRTMTFVFQDSRRASIEALLPTLPTTFTVEEVDEETGKKEKVTYDFTPHIDSGTDGTFNLVVHEQHERAVLDGMQKAGIEKSEISHPVSAKYAKLIENCKRHLEANGKQLIFTEEKTQHAKIARILAQHLPIEDNQIGIINAEDAKGDKLDKISKSYNSGAIKIVIANKKAEVGVNLQKGTTAIHHLTLPWTPASINQRNGRGVRQGNKVDTVQVYYYCGKGTFDAYRQQLLKAKSNWINELLNGTGGTAENGNLAADDEMYAAITGTLDEYRAKKAQEAEKRKQREKAQMVNRLQVLISQRAAVDSFENRKAEVRRKSEDDIAKQERLIEKLENAEQRDEQRIKTARGRLSELRKKLETLDSRMEAQHQKDISRMKMTEGMLRQAAKNGTLPFDEDLIDDPSKAVISTDGVIYTIGEFWEAKKDFDSMRSTFHKGTIYKVASIDADDKEIRVLELGEKDEGWGGRRLRVNDIKGAMKKVTVSASEEAWQTILMNEIKYADLLTCGITKQQFLDNLEVLKIRSGIARKGNSYEYVSYWNGYGEKPQWAWPEPDNKDFRKAVLEEWLRMRRERAYMGDFTGMLQKIFGEDVETMAREYGNTASPTDIAAMMSSAFEDLFDALIKSDTNTIARMLPRNHGLFIDRVRQEMQKAGYDNITDATALAEQFFTGKLEEYTKRAADEKAAAENAELERIKNNPNYKELSPEVQHRFQQLGIGAYYNTDDTVLQWKRYRDEYPAFSRIFLTDINGKAGKLFKAKDMLKSRFDAKFTQGWKAFPDKAFWHISADTNMEELFKILEA